MLSSLTFALSLLLTTLAKPIQSPMTGTISNPAAQTDISGESFPFGYAASNWCEQGYNTFTVFASQNTSAPTVADLDDNGSLPNALTSWGTFTVANFGEFRDVPAVKLITAY